MDDTVFQQRVFVKVKGDNQEALVSGYGVHTISITRIDCFAYVGLTDR